MKPADRDKARQRLAERYRYVDARLLVRLTEAGLTWLRTNQETVNQLNVYPVPDGDTGTNMTLTMQAASKEVETVNGRSIGQALQALAQGALMGARGNSGVILSQLWRGFARELEDVDEMDAQAFVRGLAAARDTAYRGVGQPVEGTILTVSKDVASAAEQALKNGATSNLDILTAAVQAADQSVENTPNLLEVLAKAGVVDAGGKGLFFILEGMLRAALGMDLDAPLVSIQVDRDRIMSVEGDVEAGQDWEVVVDFRPTPEFNMQPFTQGLTEMGVSLQLAEGEDVVRMHIHVPDQTQYEPINYCMQFGTVTNVHIENLMDQLEERREPQHELQEVEPGQIGVIGVASGAGLALVMATLGVSWIIEGGQTMNPSAEQILAAIEELPTDLVIVLPNNKNIIMAAKQAAELSDKQVRIVPTVSMPEGIAALVQYDPDGDLDQLAGQMETAGGEVVTLELTRAVRDADLDGVSVGEGQYMGLVDDVLVLAGDELEPTCLELLRRAGADQLELSTVYRGADLEAQTAEAIFGKIQSEFPDQEHELVTGGQPHYDLVLSLE